MLLANRNGSQPSAAFRTPDQNDRILSLAETIIARHNLSTFSGFLNPLQVQTLFPPVVITRGIMGMYAISNLNLMAKILLALDATAGTVSAMAEGKSVDLAQWLQGLAAADCGVLGKKGFDLQFRWYKATKRTFDFLALPTELQKHILVLAFGRGVYPNKSDWSRGQGSDYDNWRTSYTRDIVPKPEKNVFGFIAPLAEEMWKYVRKHTRKCFVSPFILRQYIRTLPLVPSGLNTVQELELSFTHSEFVHFFAVAAVPFGPHDPTDGALWATGIELLRLRALKHLYLRFQAPAMDCENAPWLHMGGERHKYGLPNRDVYGANTGTRHHFNGEVCTKKHAVSCQRGLIDWIMTYALMYIKHIPKVCLCGWVKNDTKEKWEKILMDEREGVKHDMTMAKAIVWNWDITKL